MLYTSKTYTAAFLKAFCFAVLFALTLGASVASGQSLCAADMRLTAGEDFLGFATEGEIEIFEVDVPSAGYLAVEAVAPIDAPVEPKLALFDHGCAPAVTGVKGVKIVERFVSGMVLKVRRPGSYFFAVAAQDPLLPLEYTLVTRFVNGYRIDMVGDHETDPDMVGDHETDPDMVGDHETDPDMVGDHETDPDMVGDHETDPDMVGDHETDPDMVGDHETDPDMSNVSLETKMGIGVSVHSLKTPAGLCRRGETDHHGGFACATLLTRGAGTLQGAGTFRFVLSEHQTVAIETVGGSDVLGGLYDHRGHRLAVDEGSALRIVKTLGPGEYFVRVTHRGDTEGTSTLTVTALGW